jgi:ubiquinone/menaquinone biosynthesis C-methylase UbiE
MNAWNTAGLPSDSDSPIWKRLLELQTKLLIPSELSIYYNCEGWRRAQSVLDVGTGYGEYLAVLHQLFPEKDFTGIDCNCECIEYASKRIQSGRQKISYLCSDLFGFKGIFSCVMARLVAQHIPDLPGFVGQIGRMLEPGGIFINVEPSDAMRLYYSDSPYLRGLFRSFSELQSSAGKCRDAGYKLMTLAPEYGLNLIDESHVLVPSTLPNYRGMFIRFHELIFELFSVEYRMDFDRKEAQRELDRWGIHSRAFFHAARSQGSWRDGSIW